MDTYKEQSLSAAAIGNILLAFQSRLDVKRWDLGQCQYTGVMNLYMSMKDGRSLNLTNCRDIELMLKAANMALPQLPPESDEEE